MVDVAGTGWECVRGLRADARSRPVSRDRVSTGVRQWRACNPSPPSACPSPGGFWPAVRRGLRRSRLPELPLNEFRAAKGTAASQEEVKRLNQQKALLEARHQVNLEGWLHRLGQRASPPACLGPA